MADFNAIRFQSGRPLTRELGAERLNAILTEIKRNKPKGERGITVRQSGDGTYIGLAALPKGGGTSTPATPQPWDLIVTTDPDSNQEEPPYIVRVRPGTLNGFLPTNWNLSASIAADDADIYYAKALVATDGTNITSVTIQIDTNQPFIQEAAPFGLQTGRPYEYLFGLFRQGTPWRTIGGGQITLTPRLWLTKEKDDVPSAGELPFVNYYFM